MGFWGIEVKPGKPHPYHSDNVPGILHITQATLGDGKTSERSILQCTVGHKNPIFLCSLLPNKTESCSLDLEFGDEDDVVAFSVVGSRSIHLSGYFVANDVEQLRDEYDSDSYGEDVADGSESDDSSEFDTEDEYGDLYGKADDEDDDGSEDDELAFLRAGNTKKSGVVIEEIEDDEKPTNGKADKKRKESSDSGDNNHSDHQIVLGKATSEPVVLESEDEDGFPVSASHAETQGGDKKRKIKIADDNDQLESKNKKKKKKQKEKEKEKDVVNDKSQTSPVEKVAEAKPSNDMVVDTEPSSVPSENTTEKKKAKKKKNKKTEETQEAASAKQTVPASNNKKISAVKAEEKKSPAKPAQVRTFPNGLVIEELAMGKPDGKRATRGKRVSVRYTGTLKKNGKQFDSNVGRAPFKFRLGIGEVIKGWDIGVEGMRVGDKRRLTIPPVMGYGAKGAGGAIPPNAWLMFDVELVDVN